MSTNPYAPPAADVADIAPPEEAAAESPFFAVSVIKLTVMSLCTFTLHDVYWFYTRWQRPLDGPDATATGLLLASSRTSDGVDAHGVICAQRAAQIVVTSDAADLRKLDPSLPLVVV
jgi:hypothetical protein